MSRFLESLYDSAVMGILAATAGLIGSLTRKEPGGWPHLCLGAVGAGLVGLIVAHLCHALGVNDDMTFVCVGVSGWLGAARTVSYLEKYLLRRLNFTPAEGEAENSNVRSIKDAERKRGQS